MNNPTYPTSRRDFLRLLALATGTAALTGCKMAFPTSQPTTTPIANADNPFDFAHLPIKITYLEPNLAVLRGPGGNISAHFSPDALLVVDSGIPDRAPAVLSAVSALSTTARWKLLFDTHYHFDHAGGNATFAAAGWPIAASKATRDRLSQTIVQPDMGMTFEPAPAAALPTQTFEQSMKLDAPSPITITKCPPAHTDTDAYVRFDKYNIIQTGDLLFAGTFPVIDRATHGSLEGMIAATQSLLAQTDSQTRLIPGHGPLGGPELLKNQLDLLLLTKDRLAPFMDKKATIEEVLAVAPFADLDDKYGRGFLRSPLYTKMAYPH